MKKFIILTLSLFALIIANPVYGQSTTTATNYVKMENYYKIKWGHADEFIDLWKKNHYPLLKKTQESGDIIPVIAERPILHSSEDLRIGM
ncbi:hypothetical protein [Daejeonella sp.]|uniref:hypothetical protein n=1 Tax=Daejeonella sp. TaxID=2805397 RepID=UPI0030C2D978